MRSSRPQTRLSSVRPLFNPGKAPKAPFICTRCLSSTQPQRSYPPAKSYAPLPTRRLISLRGPEAAQFLQGVTTNNLFPSTPRSAPGFYSAFLNAQGRVINDVFIYTLPSTAGDGKDGFLVEVDAKEADKLFRHIKRYKLRSKFEVRLVEEGELSVWSAWDDKEAGQWEAHSLSSPSSSSGSGSGAAAAAQQTQGIGDGTIILSDTRAPGMGRRLILPGSKTPEVDAEASTELEYRIRRYMKGVPEGQDEILREAALPQESNIDYMGGIDYRKGCYVGQELTIRTHHTGVVRKRILPVMIYSGDAGSIPSHLEYAAAEEGSATSVDANKVQAETSIKPAEKKGRSAGKFLKGVGNLGLALCRLEMMTDVVVGGEGSAGTFKDGDEFRLEGWEESGLRVKAFVPGWHLNR